MLKMTDFPTIDKLMPEVNVDPHEIGYVPDCGLLKIAVLGPVC